MRTARDGSGAGRGRWRRLAGGCALSASLILAMVGTAQAATWANEQSMVDSASFRSTFLADPGRGSLWERAALIQQHGGYYRSRGMANILTWAPRVVLDPGGAAKWAGCGALAGQEDGLCPDGQPLHMRDIGFALADTRITAFAWDGAFIALACGNFSERRVSGPTPTIAGKKFEDVDGDGSRDAGEPGLGGWRIELYQHGSLLASTTTDANGDYRFALDANQLAITSESFVLREVQQAGWVASRAPGAVHVPFGSADATSGGHDFGNYRPATITGVKFDDHDVDGERGAADDGLQGWTIGLSGGRSPDASEVTAGDGRYAFGGLIPGRYVVGETLRAGWRQSAPASGAHVVTVRSGDVKTADFGNVCLGTTRALVTREGTGEPLSGVEVRIEEIAVVGVLDNEPPLPRTTSGVPTFADLLPGTYRVVAFLPDRVYTTDPDLTLVDGRLAVVKEITVRDCAATDVPIRMFTTSAGKVTGGMRMDVPGGFATSGFEFMTRRGDAEGSLEYQDHATGMNLHTKRIEQISSPATRLGSVALSTWVVRPAASRCTSSTTASRAVTTASSSSSKAATAPACTRRSTAATSRSTRRTADGDEPGSAISRQIAGPAGLGRRGASRSQSRDRGRIRGPIRC